MTLHIESITLRNFRCFGAHCVERLHVSLIVPLQGEDAEEKVAIGGRLGHGAILSDEKQFACTEIRLPLLYTLTRLWWKKFMNTTPVSLLERLRTSADQAAWRRFAELYASLLLAWARRLGLQPLATRIRESCARGSGRWRFCCMPWGMCIRMR